MTEYSDTNIDQIFEFDNEVFQIFMEKHMKKLLCQI